MVEISGDVIGCVICFVAVYMMVWKIRRFINDLKLAFMTSLLVTFILLAILYKYTGSLSLSGILIGISLFYLIWKFN